jgi:hypothetical protein
VSYGASTAAALQLVLTLVDWLSLVMLPRRGRSFGPPKPPLISLAVVRAGIMVVMGLIAPRYLHLAVTIEFAITAVSLYALWIEPFRLEVTRQSLESVRLNAPRSGVPPLRILQIGDLHIERVGVRERELNRLITELSPDLIVFTGDFISLLHPDPDQARIHIRQVIEQWRSPLGTLVIQGSPLVETEEMVAGFVEGVDHIHWLRDEVATLETGIGRIHVVGLDTTHDRDTDIPRLRAITSTIPDDESFRILLYHSPDLAPEADELGYDLYLAGHTHGGQIRLPVIGPLITSSEFWRTYAMGRYDMVHTTLYVSRGVGMEGASAPRIRLLCRPEIVLWEINGKREPA